MFYLIRTLDNGQHQVFDRRTGQVFFTGTIDGARDVQANLNAWSRS